MSDELRCPFCGTADPADFFVDRVPVPSESGGHATGYVDGAVHCRNCEDLPGWGTISSGTRGYLVVLPRGRLRRLWYRLRRRRVVYPVTVASVDDE